MGAKKNQMKRRRNPFGKRELKKLRGQYLQETKEKKSEDSWI